jgi:hypothetical protein
MTLMTRSRSANVGSTVAHLGLVAAGFADLFAITDIHKSPGNLWTNNT